MNGFLQGMGTVAGIGAVILGLIIGLAIINWILYIFLCWNVSKLSKQQELTNMLLKEILNKSNSKRLEINRLSD